MTLQLNTVTVIRGTAPVKKAIQVSQLFRGLLPEPPPFLCRSIDWTTVFCIALTLTEKTSFMPPYQIPPDKLAALKEALGGLKERVLLKWETDTMEGEHTRNN